MNQHLNIYSPHPLFLHFFPLPSPPLPSPPLASPLLSSPLLSSPLLSSPLLSSPLLSSPLLSSPLLSSPLLSSPLLSSPLLSSPLLSSPLLSSPLLSSPFQTGFGGRTINYCHKPCHRESGCFPKGSRQARAAEQSSSETFKSGAGKMVNIGIWQEKQHGFQKQLQIQKG